MKFNREQIAKAAEILDGAKVMVLNRDFDDFQNAIITALNTFALIKELTEENERLHASCTELTQCCTKLETLYKIECKRVDTVKADTVRKMQEKIRAKSEYGTINISHWQLDQIAKEMLED